MSDVWLERLYGCSAMGRFSRWSSSSQALLVLAAVFAIGAVIDAALGHETSAIVSGVLALAVVWRTWSRQSRP
jgi:hypothetical protein